MKRYKTQFARITDTFISVTAVITAAILVASGLAVTKVNTDYTESGIRTAKIISERENEEIFFSMNGRKFDPNKNIGSKLKYYVYFLPAPLNAAYYLGEKAAEKIKQ